MHISKRAIFAILISAVVAASPAAAQGRGGGGGPKTHPVKATGPGATHMSGPKASPAPKVQGGGSAAKGPKSTATTAAGKGPKAASMTAASKGPKTTTGKAPKSTTTISTTTASTSKKSTTPTTTVTTSTVALTPVQQKLQKNTNLASKLESRLPKGSDLMIAAEGFSSLGKFVSAVNVSNNLNIPFAELKASILDDGLSLGQSIQKLRPLSDARRETSRAESQTTVLLNASATTTTTSAATSTSTSKKSNKKSSGNPQDQ